jgi:hypothetical protein
MSRTDKDAPIWARAELFVARHRLGCRPATCTLPKRPLTRLPADTDPRADCRWIMQRPCWRFHCDGPTREEIHDLWTGRVRLAVRAACHAAVQQHRATATVDVVPPIDQHHHSVASMW